jgi:hypothetical protein
MRAGWRRRVEMTREPGAMSWKEGRMARAMWYLAAGLFVIWIASLFLIMTLAHGQRRDTKSLPVWTDHPNPATIEEPAVLTKHQLFSEDHTSDVVALQQVWGAYTFYNDSYDGPGIASLFTPDGVDQHLWDDGHGKLIPDFGAVAPQDEGHNMTPEGPKGSGCILHGREQISYYFGIKRAPAPIAWPGHMHHETPSILVKVSPDGKTAILSAPDLIVGVNDKGEGHFTTGGKRAFFKKTQEGWEIAELYAINDHPTITQGCDLQGPTGMRNTQ